MEGADESIDDLDVRGKRVLVRVDFNVPLAQGERRRALSVADDTRIAAALPTIEELRARGARLVLVSHLGRPEGRREADLSMAPVAERLRELTGAKVTLAPAVVGERGQALAEAARATARSWCWRTCASSRARRSNDPELRARARGARGPVRRTTRSARRTARTRAPRASRTCCRARPGGCSNAR